MRALALSFLCLCSLEVSGAAETTQPKSWRQSLHERLSGAKKVIIKDVSAGITLVHAARWPSFSMPMSALRLAFSAVPLPSRASLRAWMPMSPSMPNASTWINSVNLTSMPSMTDWLAEKRPRDVVINIQSAIQKGWVLIPDSDRRYAIDFAVTATSVGVVTGFVTVACVVVATPGGPVLVALATAGCATVGSEAGARLVRAGYGYGGRAIDENAFRYGKFGGEVLGGGLGSGKAVIMRAVMHPRVFLSKAQNLKRLTLALRAPARSVLEGPREPYLGFDDNGLAQDSATASNETWRPDRSSVLIEPVGSPELPQF